MKVKIGGNKLPVLEFETSEELNSMLNVLMSAKCRYASYGVNSNEGKDWVNSKIRFINRLSNLLTINKPNPHVIKEIKKSSWKIKNIWQAFKFNFGAGYVR